MLGFKAYINCKLTCITEKTTKIVENEQPSGQDLPQTLAHVRRKSIDSLSLLEKQWQPGVFIGKGHRAQLLKTDIACPDFFWALALKAFPGQHSSV